MQVSDGAGHTGFSDVANWSPSCYWEQESADETEMGRVEKNELNTEQLGLSQHPELGHHVPLSRSLCNTSALTPVSKGAPGTHLTVGTRHSPALLLGLDEVALKPGCISRTLSLVNNLHLLSRTQLGCLCLEEELSQQSSFCLK